MTSADVVNLQNFPQQLATALGIPLFGGEILATIILFSLTVVPVLYLTRGKNPMVAFLSGFMVTCLGVALGWVPIWMFAVMALLIALMFGNKLAERF